MTVSAAAASSSSDTSSLVQFSIPSDPSFVYPASSFPPLSAFDKAVDYPALIIPARRTCELRKQLSHALLHLPRTKTVYPVEDQPTLRLLLLKDSNMIHDTHVQELLQTTAPSLSSTDALEQQEQEQHDYQKDSYQLTTHTLTWTYDDMSVDQVLRQLLPLEIVEIPSAFESVGSIAHLNLRHDVLPYKYLVGRVILDKNAPRIRTVVHKTGNIATEYRTFGMQVLAQRNNESGGTSEDSWNVVTVQEEGYRYQLDFLHVYWNSRLGGEHARLVHSILQDAAAHPQTTPMVVADLMAGVGPFAIPLTSCQDKTKTKNKQKKKKNQNQDNDNSNNHKHSPNHNIVVHANDLNPTSFQYLQINAKMNSCSPERLHCYNMDGRALVHELQDRGIQLHHVIMNLPATAPECLDAFRGYSGSSPRIHVHCFAPKHPPDVAEQEAMDRCATALGCRLDRTLHQVSIHVVRDVAPQKNMLCVSFILPEAVRALPRIELGAPPSSSIVTTTESTATTLPDTELVHDTHDEPDTKRVKL